LAHLHIVLIVEGNDDMREGLMLLARHEGLDAVGAASGYEALEQLSIGFRPCLILLGLVLPSMDAWEFRRAQLEDAQLASIPVAVASLADPGRMTNAEQYGVTRFVGEVPDFAAMRRVIDADCSATDSS
jgi:CheY-like chemotaxis protein